MQQRTRLNSFVFITQVTLIDLKQKTKFFKINYFSNVGTTFCYKCNKVHWELSPKTAIM